MKIHRVTPIQKLDFDPNLMKIHRVIPIEKLDFEPNLMKIHRVTPIENTPLLVKIDIKS